MYRKSLTQSQKYQFSRQRERTKELIQFTCLKVPLGPYLIHEVIHHQRFTDELNLSALTTANRTKSPSEIT